MNPRFKLLLPLVITFGGASVIFIAAKLFVTRWVIDYNVLLAANCLFFFISLLVFNMQRRAMTNSNPNVFIRSVMAGMMIKMGVVAGAVVAYVLLSGSWFNKPAVFISMFLYLVYLAVEAAIMIKLNKRKNA